MGKAEGIATVIEAERAGRQKDLLPNEERLNHLNLDLLGTKEDSEDNTSTVENISKH